MSARPVWIGPLLCVPLGRVPEYDGAEAIMAHRNDLEAEVGRLSDEIATLRAILAEAREDVYGMREAYVEWNDVAAAEGVSILLARIDAALSPAVPTRHTTSPGADAGSDPDSGSEEETP